MEDKASIMGEEVSSSEEFWPFVWYPYVYWKIEGRKSVKEADEVKEFTKVDCVTK